MIRSVIIALMFLTSAANAQTSVEIAPPPPSNTYVPTAGSAAYNHLTRIGAACQGVGAYTTPSIGPAPSSGVHWVCADLADNGVGNFSLNFYRVRQSGQLYTAAHTGIAECIGPGVGTGFSSYGGQGGNCWGGQFQAICNTPGSICQGANIEADIGHPGASTMALTLVHGPSTVFCQNNDCFSKTFINFTANGLRVGADDLMNINGDATHRPIRTGGTIINGNSGGEVLGHILNLDNIPFSGCIVKQGANCLTFAGGGGGGSSPSMFAGNTNGVIPAGSTMYFSTAGYSGGIPQAEVIAPFAFTVSNLYGKGHGPAGAGQSYTYVFMKNGVDTTLSCVVSGASQSSCSNTGVSISVAEGDRFNYRITTSAGAALVVHAATHKVQP